MKRTIFYTILGILSLAYISPASADSGPYIGATYTQLNYEESGLDLDFSTVGGLVGYNLSSTFGVELRHSRGQSNDDISGYDVDIDSMTSILGRLSLQNDTNLTPYVVVGYSQVEFDIQGFGSDDDEGLTYGAGVGFELTKGLNIGVEYTVVLDKSDYDLTAGSATLVYTF